MANLNQIFEAIGGLQARVDNVLAEQKTATEHRERVACSLEKLNKHVAVSTEQQKALTIRVEKMEPHVESYKNLRQRGIAYLSAVTLAAGTFGASIKDVVKGWLS
jgi:hypothetical protein